MSLKVIVKEIIRVLLFISVPAHIVYNLHYFRSIARYSSEFVNFSLSYLFVITNDRDPIEISERHLMSNEVLKRLT